METLPEEILYKIYKYKHQLEYKLVMDEFTNVLNDFYPITRTCDCRYDASSDVVSDTDYSDVSEYSDDFWMYEF